MISALADAGAVLERARLPRRRRRRAPSSSLRDLRDADGRLLRTYNRGRAQARRLPRGPRVPARGAADALRGDVRRRAGSPQARALADDDPRALRRSRARRLLLDRRRPRALIARRKELEDAPIPSGGSAAAFGLLRLAALTGEARYEDAALGARSRLLHTIAPAAPGRVRAPAAGDRLPARRRCARWRSSGAGRGAARARRARRRSARTSCSPAATRRRAAARGPRRRSTAARPPTCASASPASGR